PRPGSPPPGVRARSVSDVDTRWFIGSGTGTASAVTANGKGYGKINSALRRTLAMPPPATKYGVSTAVVVGRSTRTLFVKITTRPFEFAYVGPGYSTYDGIGDEVVVVPWMTSELLPVAANVDLSVGTAVTSISKPMM